MFLFPDTRVLLKGAGDLGTGVAWRLHKAGFRVLITELARPLVVRRTVAFATAVDEGEMTVEGVIARRAESMEQACMFIDQGMVPVLVDPETHSRAIFKPDVLVDAIVAKRNTGTRIDDAPFVVALGPGFTPRVDCHAVVETNRGHHLGRVWWDRPAEADTGVPGEIGGKRGERVLKAPCSGVVEGVKRIGDPVKTGEVIARVKCSGRSTHCTEVLAPFKGILRGLVRDGMPVEVGMKIGDVDARADRDACFTISDKSLAVGGGVLEAVLTWMGEHRKSGE